MTITAKELAEHLHLSPAAVSIALNGKPGVSAATRKKVLAAAKELGYDFSRIEEKNAASRRGGWKDADSGTLSGTIYLVIYRRSGAVVTDTPFFSQLSEGINAACRRHGLYLNVYYAYDGEDLESRLADWKRAGCLGLLLLGTEMQETAFRPFAESRLPVVLIDNDFENLAVDSIQINNLQGAYVATKYLISRRHKQPGYLRSSFDIHNFRERADGFYRALREAGMSTSRSVVHRLTPSIEGAYTDMKELLENNDDLADCYFADNDLIAAGAVRALKDAGHRIPEDIAVIGFDNMPVASYLEPPLATIHVPKQYMGEAAVHRLVQVIEEIKEKNHVPTKIEIGTKLIKRKSV